MLKNKNILITAGPTYEHIDPVRFIGNHSSGKMGFALAEQLAEMGANIILVTGPTNLSTNNQKINRVDVISAKDMLEACLYRFGSSDICICSAAVADYTPVKVSDQKIKKNDDTFTIELKKTVDILKTLGQMKQPNQLLVGFALETEDEEENAIGKLQRKNLDFIVLNSLNDNGAGFRTDTNKITIIDKDLNKTPFGLKNKIEVAKDICDKILEITEK